MGPKHRQTAPKTFEYLDRDDIVTQTMATFASSTVHCARCHDHKFDPISQEDYYAVQAVFAGVGRAICRSMRIRRGRRERRSWKQLLAAAEKERCAPCSRPLKTSRRVAAMGARRGPKAAWHDVEPEVS